MSKQHLMNKLHLMSKPYTTKTGFYFYSIEAHKEMKIANYIELHEVYALLSTILAGAQNKFQEQFWIWEMEVTRLLCYFLGDSSQDTESSSYNSIPGPCSIFSLEFLFKKETYQYLACYNTADVKEIYLFHFLKFQIWILISSTLKSYSLLKF